MKRRVTLWAGIVTVSFVAVFYVNIPSTLFTIFVIGIVPGTAITIPAWLMLLIYPSLLAGILYWLGKQSLFIGEASPTTRPTHPIKKPDTVTLRKTRRRKAALATKREARTAV